MPELYKYDNYLNFLVFFFSKKKQRGLKKKAADAMNVNTSFLSHILNGRQNLNEDQAFALSRFIGLSVDETNYFLLLTQKERASSSALKLHKEKEIQRLQRKQSKLSAKIESKTKSINKEEMAEYYKSWIPTALHFLSAVPEYQTVSALGNRLQLDRQVLFENIELLTQLELIERNGDNVRFTSGNIHLSSNSTWVKNYHRHIRQKTIDAIDRSQDNFHYSSVSAFAKKDYENVRTILSEAIEKIRKLIASSKEEEVYIYSTDLLELPK